MDVLPMVRSLMLPDCWVAAGLVRSAVWDRVVDAPATMPDADVDVIWFDSSQADRELDSQLELRLEALDPSVNWSVKNQSRMHVGNGDAPYQSAVDAMRYWPETATAVAVRLNDQAEIEVAAPFGLDDLFHGIIRPTPRFLAEKRILFDRRIKKKVWLSRWPILQIKLC